MNEAIQTIRGQLKELARFRDCLNNLTSMPIL
jgi:hypothetical protein